MDNQSHLWQRPDLAKLFLEGVRGGIPLAAEQIGVLLRIVRNVAPKVERLLDLGCGDGILGRTVLAAYPRATGVFLDFSPTMIEAAKQKADRERAVFIVEDLSTQQWTRAVADHVPFDVVVSGLAIHHLPDSRKRELYAEIFDLLKPGGLFLNLEHVASTSVWANRTSEEIFVDSLWAYHQKQGSTKSRDAIAQEFYHRSDRAANILAPVDVQCRWLAEIGFVEVDCFFRILELALFGGRKP
jgi:SAM-dependent methyltransferase